MTQDAGIETVDRSTQTFIALGGGFFLLYGLYAAERCWRTGTWVVEIKNHAYTGGVAMFIIGSMIVFGAGFLLSALRALSK